MGAAGTSPPALPPRKRFFLLAWGGVIAAIYLAIGTTAFSVIDGERVAAEQGHRLRMTPASPSAARPAARDDTSRSSSACSLA